MHTSGYNPHTDAYIDKAQPFAQPVLTRLRELVHKACPEIEEAIKWSRPFFTYRGVILGYVAAFKQHCTFGFWAREMADVLRDAGDPQPSSMDALGRLTTLADLPSEERLLGWFRQAAHLIDTGTYTSPVAAREKAVKAPKPAAEASPEFIAALKKNKQAASVFATFSPSCKREYMEWIAEAKRPETRDKRIAQAVDQIAEGKQRNWKYQNC